MTLDRLIIELKIALKSCFIEILLASLPFLLFSYSFMKKYLVKDELKAMQSSFL